MGLTGRPAYRTALAYGGTNGGHRVAGNDRTHWAD